MFSLMTITAYGETINYTVQDGDYYWYISKKYDVNFDELMKVNNAYANPTLNPGQVIKIPYDADSKTLHRVSSGQTFWQISNMYQVDFNTFMKLNNGYKMSYLPIGYVLIIPQSNSDPYVTYTTYTVKSGDDPWKIALNFGIPHYELLKVNGLNTESVLYPNMVLKIPVHHVPVKHTPGEKYGEYLDWWSEAQYVIPIGKTFQVMDFDTETIWKMKRTIGANHADCEPVSVSDSEIIKNVWGGTYSWVRRPVIIIVDGRKIAASMSAMPHDIQYISSNGITGHMDIHFANSTRHSDGTIDNDHQYNIKKAAGLN